MFEIITPQKYYILRFRQKQTVASIGYKADHIIAIYSKVTPIYILQFKLKHHLPY